MGLIEPGMNVDGRGLRSRAIRGSNGSGTIEQTTTRGMRILVVDHEKVHRANLAEKLTVHGHQLVLATDGEQAREKLQAEPFDVVFADAKVPKLDGVELLRWVKDGPRSQTHVVMMSSNGSIPVAVQAVKLGAFDFLKKPIPAEKLQLLLAEINRERASAVRCAAARRARAASTSIARSWVPRRPWNA